MPKVLKIQKKIDKKSINWKLGQNLPPEVLDSDIFIHCAFDNHNLHVKQNLKNNINYVGIKKILHQLRKKKKCIFIYISSQTSSKYSKSNYGKLKFLSDSLIGDNNREIIIRPGIVYSKQNSTVINSLKKLLKFRCFFYFSDKKNIYPIAIRDFCSCICKIVKLKKKDKIYYLGWPYPLSIVNFIKFICKDNNLKHPYFFYMPQSILIFFATILDFFKFSDVSLVERTKSTNSMPQMDCNNSINRIGHFFYKKFY